MLADARGWLLACANCHAVWLQGTRADGSLPLPLGHSTIQPLAIWHARGGACVCRYLHRNTDRAQAEDLIMQFNVQETTGVFLLRRKNKTVRVLSIATDPATDEVTHHMLEAKAGG